MSKETYLCVKWDLSMCQKRPIYVLFGNLTFSKVEMCCGRFTCQKRHIYVSKETYLCVKRDVSMCYASPWQSRRSRCIATVLCTKETYIHVPKETYKYMSKKTCIHATRHRDNLEKETHVCVKRDVSMCQKRRIYVSKETYLCVKRDVSMCYSAPWQSQRSRCIAALVCVKRDRYTLVQKDLGEYFGVNLQYCGACGLMHRVDIPECRGVCGNSSALQKQNGATRTNAQRDVWIYVKRDLNIFGAAKTKRRHKKKLVLRRYKKEMPKETYEHMSKET